MAGVLAIVSLVNMALLVVGLVLLLAAGVEGLLVAAGRRGEEPTRAQGVATPRRLAGWGGGLLLSALLLFGLLFAAGWYCFAGCG